MGGKVWSVDEERVFWRIIVPQSQKRIATGPTHTKTWEDLAPLMQSLMGVDAKRTYTHLGLFEHFFQNIDKGRISPNASVFVREYRKAIKTNLKATEEERAKDAEFHGQGDDATSMVNVYQDNETQDEPDLGYPPSEVNCGVHQSAYDFEDEEDDKENRPLDRFPDERGRYGAPHFPLFDPIPKADMGPDNEHAYGITVQASPSAERLVLEDVRQPHERDLAANMNSYNEFSEVQTRSLAEYSPYESAPPRALKHRNNHRTHPYADIRLRRHSRNSNKGHGRVHSQAHQENNAHCAAPGSRRSSHGYYTPTEFGRIPPMEYYDYGRPSENYHPHSDYSNHPQHTPSHMMVSYDQAPGHFHDSYGYGRPNPALHGFGNSRGWEFSDRSSSAMAANHDSSESREASCTSYNDRSHGFVGADYSSPESLSLVVRDYNSFTPETIQRPASSASDVQQLIPQPDHRDRHSGSYTMSPQVSARELERQSVAARAKEFGPLKTSDQHQP
ncbi:hypothetical protein LX32DRAFT_674239 [Colletotrichum zoysiae]|uniref:Uncharacterized protein n=1 Tax=Colletotrichum zoysiae TaxID=1216348 RepID=A0AAD9HFI0_9PEZI|nr:hypothetical protein LX32DRAFT_674239 [Colletotrichum zoysiae]